MKIEELAEKINYTEEAHKEFTDFMEAFLKKNSALAVLAILGTTFGQVLMLFPKEIADSVLDNLKLESTARHSQKESEELSCAKE